MNIQVSPYMRRLAKEVVGRLDDAAVMNALDLSVAATDVLTECADNDGIVTLLDARQKTIAFSVHRQKSVTEANPGRSGIPLWTLDPLHTPQWSFTPRPETINAIWLVKLRLGISDSSEVALRSLEIVRDGFARVGTKGMTIRGKNGDTSLLFGGTSLMKVGILYMYEDGPGDHATRHAFPKEAPSDVTPSRNTRPKKIRRQVPGSRSTL